MIYLRLTRINLCFLWLCIVLGLSHSNVNAQTNYFWNGSGAVNNVLSWGVNSNGTGANPSNFTTANQIFNIQNGQSATLGSAWTISGTGSRLAVASGGSFDAGTINANLTLNLSDNATYRVAGTTYSSLSVGTINSGSTFIFAGSSGFRSTTFTYGNFVNQASNILNPGTTWSTLGNLQQSSSNELRLTGTNNVTVGVGKDLIVDASRVLNLTSGNGTAAVNVAGNLLNSGTISKSGAGATTINFSGTGSTTATWGTITSNSAVNIAIGRSVTFLDSLSASSVLTNSGTLRVGNGGTSGAVLGNFVNNGSTVFDRSDSVTHGTIISGSGSLSKVNGNTLTLSGLNSYAGSTTVGAGTLTISGTGSIGGSGVTVDNGATLNINAGGLVNTSVNVSAGGTLSGTGTITGATSVSGTHNIGNSPGLQVFGDNLS